MNITITHPHALAFIEEANKAGIAHSLVEVPGTGFPGERGNRKWFEWNADCNGPTLCIELNADGTWKPTLLGVMSPGVDAIDGYDHTLPV
jgi:hypothetical protein